MGQKTNPNIFRLGKTKNWNSKHFEKKSSETKIYTFKDLEIRKFINKFFKNNGLKIYNCKLHYSDEGTLNIFISYYLTLQSVFLISQISHSQKIKLNKQKNKFKLKKKHVKVQKHAHNYIRYQKMIYNKKLNKYIEIKNFRNIKNTIVFEKKKKNFRRINLLKYYKKAIISTNHQKLEYIKTDSFLEKFSKSLHLFINKKINVYITFKQLNKSLKQNLTKANVKLLKKSVVQLRKYEQNEFSKEGINVLLLCTTKTNSASLLAEFIATQLKKLKRHNFFLRFIKAALIIFNNNPLSKLQGIKIKIKGRINGAPRAKHKIITINNGVPVLSLKSKVDYAEATSYTANGTLGVKIWMY